MGMVECATRLWHFTKKNIVGLIYGTHEGGELGYLTVRGDEHDEKGSLRFSAVDCALVCSVDNKDVGCAPCAEMLPEVVNWEKTLMEADKQDTHQYTDALTAFAKEKGIALLKSKASTKSVSELKKSGKYAVFSVFHRLAAAILAELAPATSPEEIKLVVKSSAIETSAGKKQKVENLVGRLGEYFKLAVAQKDRRQIIATGALLVEAGLTREQIQVMCMM
jgi:predicted Fe-S protein YdhL (DUF1289 family)